MSIVNSYLKRKKKLSDFKGYVFLIPALILYILFVIYPFIQMLIIPFTTSGRGMKPERAWVGFENFINMFNDDRFMIAVKNNLFWTIGTLVLPLVIGFILAEVLARGKVMGRNVFRMLIFIPQAIAPVVVGVVFNWIYQPRWGVLNTILNSFGLTSLSRAWLGSEATALPALIVAGVWRETAFFMVVFLAAMQKIPNELYEAAKLDGANAFQEMIHITITGIRKEITFMSMLAIIIGFRVFDLVRVMTRGGPFNQTEVLTHLLYNVGFTEFDSGKASAIGVFLTAIIFISTSIVLFTRERNE